MQLLVIEPHFLDVLLHRNVVKHILFIVSFDFISINFRFLKSIDSFVHEVFVDLAIVHLYQHPVIDFFHLLGQNLIIWTIHYFHSIFVGLFFQKLEKLNRNLDILFLLDIVELFNRIYDHHQLLIVVFVVL